jgi:hypothetical protein
VRQREPRWQSRALLDACHEIPCQGGWSAGCGNSMTEPAHSNQARHGKGKSIKSHDCFVAGLCRSCHQAIDQGSKFTRQQRFDLWQKAHEKTLLILFQRGLVEAGIVVPVLDCTGAWVRPPQRRATPTASPRAARASASSEQLLSRASDFFRGRS